MLQIVTNAAVTNNVANLSLQIQMTKTNTLPAVTGCVKKCYREYETEKLGQMT